MKTPLHGLHLHFDPTSGIAGDMTVAALVDAGVPERVVVDAIAAMGVRGLKVGFEARKRGGMAGKGFLVDWPGKAHKHDHDHDYDHGHDHDHHDHDHGHDHDHHHDHDDDHGHDHVHAHKPGHHHRDFAEIRRLLKKAKLDSEAKRLAGEIFERIAVAEARMHGVAIDKVAFHEVGAWDSIADIVGAAAAVAWLEPSGVTSSPPVLGSGTIRSAHGLLPVPAPATAALLQGIPVLNDGRGELTTPTGAAILATLVRDFGAAPPMRLQAQGFGAGTREFADRPNVLRVLLGQSLGQAMPGSAGEVLLLQSNIDDMNPQLVEPLMSGLLAAGALDVWATSILMKKGRPALEVSALVTADALTAVERAFFCNSTTLGVRRQPLSRSVLARAMATVDTRFGSVPIKLATLGTDVLGANPEFEDCRRLAEAAGVPVRAVLAEANAAAVEWLRPPETPQRRRRR